MFELYRACALGAAASIAAATAALALDAPPPATPEVQKAEALVSDGVPVKAQTDASCPRVALAPDGDAFPKAADDYKATLRALARDCADLGAETIMKVSLVGEGERQTKNGPSWFKAPLRLTVRDAAGNPVETRKIPLRVTLPSGALKAPFDYTEQEVSLPRAEQGGYAGWSVTVGFDPALSAAPDRPSKAKRAAVVRHAARVARAAPKAAPLPPANPATAAVAQPASSDSPWQKIAKSFSERQQAQAIAQAQQAQAAAKAQQAQQQRAAPQANAGRRPAAQPQASAAKRPSGIRTAERAAE